MAERKEEPLQALKGDFRSLQLKNSVEFSIEDSLRQAKSKLIAFSLEIGITSTFIPVETSHPRAQILLSCDSKRGKIPFGTN